VINFTAHKLAMFIGISSELIGDSVALSKSVAPLMTRSLAFSLDNAVLTGNGITRPLGIINAQATIGVGRATGDTIAFADLANMLARLVPASLGEAMWIVSPSAFALLVRMEVATNSGQLAMSSTVGAGKLALSLWGMPVRVSEKLPALGTTGDVILADLSYYALAMREEGRLESTISAAWTSDQTDLRLIVRADGGPLVDTPITPAGGGDTISPFVRLDA